jgi:hypothetical protein
MTKIIGLNILLITLGFFIHSQQIKMAQVFTKNEPCLYNCGEVVKKSVVIIKSKTLV